MSREFEKHLQYRATGKVKYPRNPIKLSAKSNLRIPNGNRRNPCKRHRRPDTTASAFVVPCTLLVRRRLPLRFSCRFQRILYQRTFLLPEYQKYVTWKGVLPDKRLLRFFFLPMQVSWIINQTLDLECIELTIVNDC